MKQEKKRHVTITLNPSSNGGELITLETIIRPNGKVREDGTWFEQKLTLNSYVNSCTITMADVFTPKQLRELADELEKERDAFENSIEDE